MSSGATLNSRLRVLIAKAFRAEQLYASMRHHQSAKRSNVSEVANDLRASVWQRVYSQLRTSLNEAVTLNSSTALASRIGALQQVFEAQAKEAADVVAEGAEELIQTSERHEFAHGLKLSLELVQHKARAQANQVVADELAEILQLSGRKKALTEAAQSEQVELPEGEGGAVVNGSDDVSAPPSNVIPFRRKAVGRR